MPLWRSVYMTFGVWLAQSTVLLLTLTSAPSFLDLSPGGHHAARMDTAQSSRVSQVLQTVPPCAGTRPPQLSQSCSAAVKPLAGDADWASGWPMPAWYIWSAGSISAVHPNSSENDVRGAGFGAGGRSHRGGDTNPCPVPTKQHTAVGKAVRRCQRTARAAQLTAR